MTLEELIKLSKVKSNEEYLEILNKNNTEVTFTESLGIVYNYILRNFYTIDYIESKKATSVKKDFDIENTYEEIEDLVAVASIGLIEAIRVLEKNTIANYIEFVEFSIYKRLNVYLLNRIDYREEKANTDYLEELNLEVEMPDEQLMLNIDLESAIEDLIINNNYKNPRQAYEEAYVLREFYLKGKTLDVIAKELGITLDMVRNRKDKALRRMKHPRRAKKIYGYHKSM